MSAQPLFLLDEDGQPLAVSCVTMATPFISSDLGAWMRPYDVTVAARRIRPVRPLPSVRPAGGGYHSGASR